MKNSEEMVNSLLERRDKYAAEKKGIGQSLPVQ